MRLLMKHSILLLVFSLISMTGFSQIVIENTEVEGSARDEKIALDITLTNLGTETDGYHWILDRTASFPAEWEIQICDCWLCYDWGQEESTCEDQCMLKAGESATFSVYIKPNGVEAVGMLDLKFVDDCSDLTTEKVGASLTYNVSNGTSTDNLDGVAADLVIFPNPAFNSFFVNDDQNVDHLVIYNIVGKEMYESAHIAGQSHNVTNLEKGIYLVRMMDNKNEVLKVVRLTKD